LALLFCDLDDFKDVNDGFGHAAGDELLRTTARRLTGSVRSADTVARLGGDEFAVLLDGCPGDPEATAQQIIDTVRGPSITVDTHAYPVRLSTGLVVIDADTGPVEAIDVLRSADLAMYAAKHRGKGGLVIHHPEHHGPICQRLVVPRPLDSA
jgi:diguanylate cyclase (GGDEF)-like protein